MIVTDHQGNILRVNSAFEKILGYVADELVGKKTFIFKSPEYHDDAFYRNLWGRYQQKESGKEASGIETKKGGRFRCGYPFLQ